MNRKSAEKRKTVEDQFATQFWKRVVHTVKLSGYKSVREFCMESGFVYNSIGNSININRIPSGTNMIWLSQKLNVSLDYLVFGKEDIVRVGSSVYTAQSLEIAKKYQDSPEEIRRIIDKVMS